MLDAKEGFGWEPFWGDLSYECLGVSDFVPGEVVGEWLAWIRSSRWRVWELSDVG